jgi:hypothetical protein
MKPRTQDVGKKLNVNMCLTCMDICRIQKEERKLAKHHAGRKGKQEEGDKKTKNM